LVKILISILCVSITFVEAHTAVLIISIIGTVGGKPRFAFGVSDTISISIVSLPSTVYIIDCLCNIYDSQRKYGQPVFNGIKSLNHFYNKK